MLISRLQYQVDRYFATVRVMAGKVAVIPAVKTDRLDVIQYFGDQHQVPVIA